MSNEHHPPTPLTWHGHPVALVILDDDGRVQSLQVGQGRYDEVQVYHTTRHGILCHAVGSGPTLFCGPSDAWWLAEGLEPPATATPDLRVPALTPGQLLEIEAACEHDGDLVWCMICQDDLPDDDLCRHLYWDEEIGIFLGCGDEDYHGSDLFDIYGPSMAALLHATGLARELTAALQAHDYAFQLHGDMFGWQGVWAYLQGTAYHERFQPLFDRAVAERAGRAFQWLLSLEAGTTNEADAQTVAWIARCQQEVPV